MDYTLLPIQISAPASKALSLFNAACDAQQAAHVAAGASVAQRTAADAALSYVRHALSFALTQLHGEGATILLNFGVREPATVNGAGSYTLPLWIGVSVPKVHVEPVEAEPLPARSAA